MNRQSKRDTGTAHMKPHHIGLLPLYLELYDRLLPNSRARMEVFLDQVRQEFERRGVRVSAAPICRLEREVQRAIHGWEQMGADAIVTLHLAYSPSLESAPALARTKIPLIVLDTAPTFDFGPTQDPDEIMYNHGIHGVQDLCNLLVRHGKPFRIEAGHWSRSNVIQRVMSHLPSARMAAGMASARVGLIGKPFVGMGDFSVPEADLRRAIGARVIRADRDELLREVRRTDRDSVRKEMAADQRAFAGGAAGASAHEHSVIAGLAVRRWIERAGLTAFSMNFQSAGRRSGLPAMPFLEISKAMARGTGYAGEGDVLTAALVGALMSAIPATTFTEMFCADWKGNRVLLSHMGEINLDLVDGKPRLLEPGMNFTPGKMPVVPYGRLRGGDAVFVNLAPLGAGSFRLIVAPGRMQSVRGKDRFQATVRGWFKPRMPVADFLAEYSRQGGGHHAALVYGNAATAVAAFGQFMGWDVRIL